MSSSSSTRTSAAKFRDLLLEELAGSVLELNGCLLWMALALCFRESYGGKPLPSEGARRLPVAVESFLESLVEEQESALGEALNWSWQPTDGSRASPFMVQSFLEDLGKQATSLLMNYHFPGHLEANGCRGCTLTLSGQHLTMPGTRTICLVQEAVGRQLLALLRLRLLHHPQQVLSSRVTRFHPFLQVPPLREGKHLVKRVQTWLWKALSAWQPLAKSSWLHH
ncbi:hypothetical protein Efla_001290 [Eimeria flavescens]